MNKKIKRVDHGFTIIEVLIVLAIAGLILAVVFFAVPQLKRGQRDNQRQSIATRLSSELDSYAGNHGGLYPFSAGFNAAYAGCSTLTTGSNPCSDWLTNYITNGNVNINDPGSGGDSAIWLGGDSGGALPGAGTAPAIGSAVGNVYITVGATCKNGTLNAGSDGKATTNRYAIVVNLERSGTSYCVSNS